MTVLHETEYTIVEPPEPHYVMADCQHEVYDGELMVTWEKKTLCPDCFMDKVKEMTVNEVATLMGVEYKEVS